MGDFQLTMVNNREGSVLLKKSKITIQKYMRRKVLMPIFLLSYTNYLHQHYTCSTRFMWICGPSVL